MKETIKFFEEIQANGLSLDELVRKSAQKVIHDAVMTELALFLESCAGARTPEGKLAVVRNGYLPERNVTTKAGTVRIQIPKVRDRSQSGIKFNSRLIPPYLKRSDDVTSFIPWLYLKGVSTGDMSDVLFDLLGENASAVTPDLIGRLKKQWVQEYDDWSKRTITDDYVYIWADGVYCDVRMGDKACLLVVLGVRQDGVKELLAIHDGERESSDSWYETLVDLQLRGLKPPKLAIGDGAMGFWNALSKLYPSTKQQRCWFHKMGNILNKAPKSMQSNMKKGLQDIWMAPTKAAAEKAYQLFISQHQAKYPSATVNLTKDIEALLSFYDFPALHWSSIRTTNPIESTFASIRQRTARMKGCTSRETALTMVFKLAQEAGKRYHRLKGFALLGDVVQNCRFKDGVKIDTAA